MERTINTKYYYMSQNNSGGYFIENDDVAQYVIIEAISPEQATLKANDITQYYGEYCECCGTRWSTDFYESYGTDEPMIYGENAYTYSDGLWSASTIIYHLDGTKEKLRFKED